MPGTAFAILHLFGGIGVIDPRVASAFGLFLSSTYGGTVAPVGSTMRRSRSLISVLSAGVVVRERPGPVPAYLGIEPSEDARKFWADDNDEDIDVLSVGDRTGTDP